MLLSDQIKDTPVRLIIEFAGYNMLSSYTLLDCTMIIVVLYIVFQKKKAAPHVTRSVCVREIVAVSRKMHQSQLCKKKMMEKKLLGGKYLVNCGVAKKRFLLF